MIRFSPGTSDQDAPASVVVFVFSGDAAGQAAFAEFLAKLASPSPPAAPPKRPGNTERSFQGA